LKFSKTITLPQDSVVYATGHIITNQKGGRADLYLRLNNGIRDYALSEDSTGQWVDLTVNNAVTLKKGKYTYSLTTSKNSRFGCGASWGDLDLVVVPKFKGVAAYNEPDRKSGCPAKRAANSDLILKTIKVDQTSVIKVTGHIIRTFSGRADAYLKYQRKSTLDTSLTYTNNKRWEDVKLHFTGTFGKGTHTFSIRSNRANAFGCGTAWGDIDILVLPQKMVGGAAKKNNKEARQSVCEKQRRLQQIAQVRERERKGRVRQMPERVHQLGRQELQKNWRDP
jgi:hypothetical protein